MAIIRNRKQSRIRTSITRGTGHGSRRGYSPAVTQRIYGQVIKKRENFYKTGGTNVTGCPSGQKIVKNRCVSDPSIINIKRPVSKNRTIRQPQQKIRRTYRRRGRVRK